jgi:hypothetical protein
LLPFALSHWLNVLLCPVLQVFPAVVMGVGSETFPVAVLSVLSGCAQFMSASLLFCRAGVVGYYGADDVPGDNMIGPIMHDEEVFATKEVTCVGQVRFTLLGIALTMTTSCSGVTCIQHWRSGIAGGWHAE